MIVVSRSLKLLSWHPPPLGGRAGGEGLLSILQMFDAFVEVGVGGEGLKPFGVFGGWFLGELFEFLESKDHGLRVFAALLEEVVGIFVGLGLVVA